MRRLLITELYENNAGGLIVARGTMAFSGLEHVSSKFGEDAIALYFGDVGDWTVDRCDPSEIAHGGYGLVAVAAVSDLGSLVTVVSDLGAAAKAYIGCPGIVEAGR